MIDISMARSNQKKLARKSKAPARKQGPKRKPQKKRQLKSSLGESFGNMVRNPGNGACSTSSFSNSKPASKVVKSIDLIGAPNIGFQNKTFSVKHLSGTQGSTFCQIMPVSLLNVIADRVGSATTTGRPPWRFVVQETLDTFHMTNGTGSTLEVDLYDIFPKRNIPSQQDYVPPGQVPTVGPPSNIYELNDSPLEYWEQGSRLAGSTAADASLAVNYKDFYNATPMDSPLFKTYFRVSQRTRIFLPQGASHKHTVTRHINQLVNTSECITGEGSLGSLTKCSSYLMIVVRGEPVQGTTIDDPAVNLITTSKGNLQVVQTARYKWTWAADTTYSNYYINQLASVTALANINPATGTADPIEQLLA